MDISGIKGSGSNNYQNLATGSSGEDSAVQEFESYFKESTAQRMVDTWLLAHHITKAQFDSMTPEQQNALKKQMASDIQNEMKQKTEQTLCSEASLLG